MSIKTDNRSKKDRYWRQTQAKRAAVLQNGCRYFKTVREIFLEAERSIFIVGWDIDSRVELVRGEDEPDNNLPVTLADVLSDSIQKHPELQIYLLIWDYSLVFAAERETLPKLNWSLKIQERLHFCFDDTMPIGGSHHQKIVVIDDSIAFCGGLDLTNNRWDRIEHKIDDPLRKDPSDSPFGPYHDLQMMLDGEVAADLGELVRERWKNASKIEPVPLVEYRSLWPEEIEPDFENIKVNIARTVPQTAKTPCIDEILQCYLYAIGRAKEFIYIENQYLASEKIADALIRQMKQNPGLKFVAISSMTPSYGWFETHSMAAGRASFKSLFEEAGLLDRVLIIYPLLGSDNRTETLKVHSKLMIIDNDYLQIGSANISNRSMTVDTECDIVIEADNDRDGKHIAGILSRLIAEYLKRSPEEIYDMIDQKSVFEVLKDHIGQVPGFRYIREPQQDSQLSEIIRPLADPDKPLVHPGYFSFADKGRGSARSLNNIYKVLIILGILLILASLWKWTSLSEWVDPEKIEPVFLMISEHDWSVILILSLYVLGGIIFFPVTIMIAMTAAVFGPTTGFVYALAGSLLSAVVSFAIGTGISKSFLSGFLEGKQFRRVNRLFSEYGIFSVVFVRMVPIAPFSFVNLVAGVSHISLKDFVYGTIIGMTPGILMLSLVGDSVRKLWQSPSVENYMITGLAISAWLVISYLLQRLINKWRQKRLKTS